LSVIVRVMSLYYNIDDILAEEEIVPCTSLFTFSHLAHLDPDCREYATVAGKRKRSQSHFLPENTRIKMPLWSIRKWAMLGFIRLTLPNHFGRKSRENLLADPASADLRCRNERFFMSGILLLDLIQRCSNVMASAVAGSNRNGNSRSRTQAAMAKLLQETDELRRILLSTYTGERLRRTFDWTLTSIDDDVSAYTRRLTDLELVLFHRGADAAAMHHSWKNNGTRRITVSSTVVDSKMFEPLVQIESTTDIKQGAVSVGGSRNY